MSLSFSVKILGSRNTAAGSICCQYYMHSSWFTFLFNNLAKASSNSLNKNSECGWPETASALPTLKLTVGFYISPLPFWCTFLLHPILWVLLTTNSANLIKRFPCCCRNDHVALALRWGSLCFATHLLTYSQPTTLASGRWRLLLGRGLWSSDELLNLICYGFIASPWQLCS